MKKSKHVTIRLTTDENEKLNFISNFEKNNRSDTIRGLINIRFEIINIIQKNEE